MPLFALLLLSTLLSTAPRTWNDSTRDVYVNGSLDRTVRTLTSESPRMVAVICGDELLLLDPATNTVSRSNASALTFAADRTTATSAELTAEPVGSFVRPDPSSYLVRAGDRTLLLAAHQSKAGPMTLAELWATVPVWRSIADAYEPDAAAVAELRAIQEPTAIQIVMATWCGDSKKHVPRLLKSIERANNPNVTVEIMGIGPDFESPMDFIQRESITNVPTVIVRRGAAEIGRYIETPATATIEQDVVAIAAARQQPHPGALARGAKVAEGTYALRDARRRASGTERFTVYERPGGGFVAHSVISMRDGRRIETFATLDAERKPRFAEVTLRANGQSTRARFRHDGTHVSAISRGASGGVTSQTVAAPAALLTPATVTYGWAGGADAYVAPEEGVGAVRRVGARVEMDRLLNVPRVVRLADGSERRLVR